MSPVLSSLVLCQTPVMRREPPPLPLVSTPRLLDVCVLTHLSESRPCGCWWLIQGLTPVTTSHNTSHGCVWSSAHQSLMSSPPKDLKELLCFGYIMHTHLPNIWLDILIDNTDINIKTEITRFLFPLIPKSFQQTYILKKNLFSLFRFQVAFLMLSKQAQAMNTACFRLSRVTLCLLQMMARLLTQ